MAKVVAKSGGSARKNSSFRYKLQEKVGLLWVTVHLFDELSDAKSKMHDSIYWNMRLGRSSKFRIVDRGE